MPQHDLHIRRLGVADAAIYRDLRLEGLLTHPQAFTAAHEIESRKPLSFFEERVASSHVIGGSLGGRPVAGIMGLHIPPSPRTGHIGDIWGVYLQDVARGTGLASAMLNTLVEEARGKVEAVTLGVGAYNIPAQRAYLKAGFLPVAFMPRVVRVGETYYDEILMRLELR